MTPASSSELDLTALTRRLGHRKREVREGAAQALHEHGTQGLDALLAAWQHEERWEFQRSLIGAAAFVLVIGGSFWFLRSHHHTNTEAMWACFIMIGGMIGATVFMFPARRRREIAAALLPYDAPRVLPYLAQSLRLITTDDPRRAQLIAKLRQVLQETPSHEMTFPGTKYVLHWQPERTRRTIRPFWMWVSWMLLAAPVMLTLYGFFFTHWLKPGAIGGLIGPMFGMPILYTWLACKAETILREDVTYTPRNAPTRNLMLLLVSIGVIIASVGVLTHLITHHHPSWLAVAWASVGVPVCWRLANLAGKRALPEPPDKQP